jgi:hypothetical protein
LIAVLWDDLDPEDDDLNPFDKGDVYIKVVGEETSFIVEWSEVGQYVNEDDDGDPDDDDAFGGAPLAMPNTNSFQVELFPSGVIEMRYGVVSTIDFTVGVENDNGTDGLQVEDSLVKNGNTCIRIEIILPSESPSASPSESPSASPSESPSASPSESPSASPSGKKGGKKGGKKDGKRARRLVRSDPTGSFKTEKQHVRGA